MVFNKKFIKTLRTDLATHDVNETMKSNRKIRIKNNKNTILNLIKKGLQKEMEKKYKP